MPTIQITRNRYKPFPVGGKNDIVPTVRKRTEQTVIDFIFLTASWNNRLEWNIQSLKELLNTSSIFEKWASLNSGLKKTGTAHARWFQPTSFHPEVIQCVANWKITLFKNRKSSWLSMDIIIHDYVWISLQYNHHIMMVSWLYKYYIWLSSMNGPWLPVRELLTWRWWTFPQRKGSDGEMTQFQRLLGPHRKRLLSYRFPTLRNFRHPACPGSTGIYI